MASSGTSRPSKRQRQELFRPGAVIKVEVRNFMTYDHAVIEPGPRLNLVLGPNGTGKSSLVCAICVGLAGSTKLLGRAEDVSSFVRRGCRDGDVEITLATDTPGETLKIKRKIHLDNKSEWQINRKPAIMRDVTEAVKDLNIQLDNLCQFLPQDKVVEFARMKPVELLLATERAVGNATLAELHDSLIETRSQLKIVEGHAAAAREDVHRLKEENNRNERSIAQIRQREALLEEIALLEKKLPWARYQEAKTEYENEQVTFKAQKDILAAEKRKMEEQTGPLNAMKKLRDAAVKKEKTAKNELRKFENDDDNEKLTSFADDINTKSERIAGLEKKAADRIQAINNLKAEVERLQLELAECEADTVVPQAVLDEKERVTLQLKELNSMQASLASSVRDNDDVFNEASKELSNLENKLSQISDARLQRVKALDAKARGDGKYVSAWTWLRSSENKSKFKGRVYGPLAAEIDVQNPLHAKILEQHIAQNTWQYFAVEYSEDQDLLDKIFKDKFNGFRPKVACFKGNADDPLQYRKGPASKYAKYGITHTLDQVFGAPPLVKHVLDDLSNITAAFIGSDAANSNWEKFFNENPEPAVLWTSEAQYRRNVSYYNREAQSVAVNPLRPAQIFGGGAGGGMGDSERARLESQIAVKKDEIKQCKQVSQELQSQMSDTTSRIKDRNNRRNELDKEITKNQRKKRDITFALNSKKGALATKQKTKDPLSDKPKLEKELEKLQNDVVQFTSRLVERLSAKARALIKHVTADLALKELNGHVSMIENANKDSIKRVTDMERNVAAYEEEMKKLKDKAKTLMRQAKDVVELTQEVQGQFEPLPDSVYEIQESISTKHAEAEGFVISDPGALQRYNQRCEVIRQREGELEGYDASIATLREKLESEKALWLPELRRITATINNTFSVNFAGVGTAGEVVLHEAEDDDFANFAIEIRVKFRESEALQTLDASRQSGGERSVSTIIFLVALQGVTVTPFRVVDEINQGMDPVNERKVFRQLVDAATQPDTPQCFLLTPKLLPDLPFSSQVTVLQIMNGPHIREVAKGFTMDRLFGPQRLGLAC